MEYPEQVANLQIPVDRNANFISLMSGLSTATGQPVPVGLEQLPDGTFAIKTTSAGVIKVTNAATVTPVTVTDVATAILAVDATRKGHILFNAGTSIIYVGINISVTTATGIPIAAGASFNLDLPGTVYAGAIYGIASAGESSEIRGITYHD